MNCSSPALGIDGLTPRGVLSGDPCCPPTICNIDLCGLACNFIGLLPTGPLWDIPKLKAFDRVKQYGDPACGEPKCEDSDCVSIVRHAVYSAHKLHHYLFGALWPALRESDPATAYDTLDSWLDRYGWQDCWKCGCDCEDDPGSAAPFDLIFPDGRRICCPSEAPAGLDMAVKKGVVIALHRLRLGITPNIASINFVISSLGAMIEPDLAAVNSGEPCCNPSFVLSPTGFEIPAACLVECPRTTGDAPIGAATDCWGMPCCHAVKSYWNLDCDGEGDGRAIFPGVLAAHCIVRSLLPDPSIRIRRLEVMAR